MSTFKPGDIVQNENGPTSTRGCPLACGSGFYADAIVVQADPFVVVSREGDMKWSCLGSNAKHLRVIGTASKHESKAAFARFKRGT